MTQLTVAVDVLLLLSVRLHGVILNFMVPSTDWHLEGEKRNSQIYWRERKERPRSQLVTFFRIWALTSSEREPVDEAGC